MLPEVGGYRRTHSRNCKDLNCTYRFYCPANADRKYLLLRTLCKSLEDINQYLSDNFLNAFEFQDEAPPKTGYVAGNNTNLSANFHDRKIGPSDTDGLVLKKSATSVGGAGRRGKIGSDDDDEEFSDQDGDFK